MTQTKTTGRSADAPLRQRRPPSNKAATTAVNAPAKTQKSSQQQRMIRQMRAQRRQEREEHEAEQEYSNAALTDLFVRYLKTLLLLLLIGSAVYYYYAPERVAKWYRRVVHGKPKLPPRQLTTIYPEIVPVKRSLPRFYGPYALANHTNQAARQAVQHVAQLRYAATDPGPMYQQKISFLAWEHEDFTQQVPNESAMDKFCGPNFGQAYQQAAANPQQRDELLLWCLVATGHHDGWVAYQVQHLFGSLARGTSGIALLRYDTENDKEPRVLSSIVLLPQHSMDVLALGKPLQPSTHVPFHMLSWLRDPRALMLSPDEFVIQKERNLFRAIQSENEEESSSAEKKWIFWQAACTARTRRELDAKHRKMGTTCREKASRSGDNTGDDDDNDVCCSFYDPELPPFRQHLPKTRESSDKDDDDEEEN